MRPLYDPRSAIFLFWGVAQRASHMTRDTWTRDTWTRNTWTRDTWTRDTKVRRRDDVHVRKCIVNRHILQKYLMYSTTPHPHFWCSQHALIDRYTSFEVVHECFEALLEVLETPLFVF